MSAAGLSGRRFVAVHRFCTVRTELGTLQHCRLILSLFRPIPEKRADWAAGILQLVLGGAWCSYGLLRAAQQRSNQLQHPLHHRSWSLGNQLSFSAAPVQAAQLIGQHHPLHRPGFR